MKFEWDPTKEKLNLRKHRVSFLEAETALLDPLSKTFTDPYHSSEEIRFLTYGVSLENRLLVVSHTERDQRIRIISARQATRQERQKYEEG
jgi:uncharacterized DUF497 family protein